MRTDLVDSLISFEYNSMVFDKRLKCLESPLVLINERANHSRIPLDHDYPPISRQNLQQNLHCSVPLNRGNASDQPVASACRRTCIRRSEHHNRSSSRFESHRKSILCAAAPRMASQVIYAGQLSVTAWGILVLWHSSVSDKISANQIIVRCTTAEFIFLIIAGSLAHTFHHFTVKPILFYPNIQNKKSSIDRKGI
jgi:hypothetical protein